MNGAAIRAKDAARKAGLDITDNRAASCAREWERNGWLIVVGVRRENRINVRLYRRTLTPPKFARALEAQAEARRIKKRAYRVKDKAAPNRSIAKVSRERRDVAPGELEGLLARCTLAALAQAQAESCGA